MGIRQTTKKPDLPPARLYLEDIEEIVEVMKEESKKENQGTDDIPISFTIGDRECDSAEDLKKLGGKSRDFNANVGKMNFNISVTHTYCPETEPVFDKVMRLMSARELKLKATVRRIPFGFLGVLWLLLVPGIIGTTVISLKISPLSATLIYMLPVVLLFSIKIWSGFTHSVVELRYSYEPSPKRKILELGVLLASVAQWLWHYLTKH